MYYALQLSLSIDILGEHIESPFVEVHLTNKKIESGNIWSLLATPQHYTNGQFPVQSIGILENSISNYTLY